MVTTVPDLNDGHNETSWVAWLRRRLPNLAAQLGRTRSPSAIAGAALVAVSGVSLLPVVFEAGWPINHEFTSFFTRTLIYSEHLGQGDLFPIWSGADNAGLGSPQPALYHKLFYLVAGLFHLVVGGLKTAVVLSLWFWLVVGAWGTYRLCRALGCDRVVATSGGVLLVVANYTVTNWLVRGAMAELSAAMLVPWVLALFVRSARDGRLRPALGVALGLVLLAHSALAYFLVLLFLLTGLALLAARLVPLTVLAWRPLLATGGLFALVSGPYLLAMAVLAHDYDPTRIIPPPYLPENQVRPLRRYVWDTQWDWGQTWQGFTIQLDTAVLVLLAVGLVAIGVSRIAASRIGGSGDGRLGFRLQLPSAPVAALVLVGVGALVLQTGQAGLLYQHLPGAAYLQFPWRLLAILTPVTIGGAMLAAQRLPAWRWRRLPRLPCVAHVGAGVAIVWSVAVSGLFPAPGHGQLSPESVGLTGIQLSAFGEYVPERAGLPFPAAAAVIAAMEDEGCVQTPDPTSAGAEDLTRRLTIVCGDATTVVLALFASPGHLVTTANGTVRCGERDDFPGYCAVAVPAGTTEVKVKLPTFATLVRAAFTATPS